MRELENFILNVDKSTVIDEIRTSDSDELPASTSAPAYGSAVGLLLHEVE